MSYFWGRNHLFKKKLKQPSLFKKLGLFLMIGCLVTYFSISAISFFSSAHVTSSTLKRWTTHISASTFQSLLAMEMPGMGVVQKQSGSVEKGLSTLLLEMVTSLNPKDPRSLIRRELPGFVFFDGELIISGLGANYTDIPMESAPPLEVVMAEREAVANEQNSPLSSEKLASPRLPNSTEGRNVVLIYHTHNRESWLPHVPSATSPNEAFHAEMNISKVGVRLAEELRKRGIGTYVDTTDIAQKLQNDGLSFAFSYAKSREVVQQALAQEKDIQYLFDLHRDSATRERTTIKINGQEYARLFFVIGGRNKNHEKNLHLAKQVHQLLEERYPGLSRGVYLKDEGNGEYNQSLSANNLLIEVGGIDNTIDESYRTVEALAEVIADLYWDAQKVSTPSTEVSS